MNDEYRDTDYHTDEYGADEYRAETAPARVKSNNSWWPLLLLPVFFFAGWVGHEIFDPSSTNQQAIRTQTEYGVGGGPEMTSPLASPFVTPTPEPTATPDADVEMEVETDKGLLE